MSQQNKTRIVGLIVIVLLTTASTAGAVAYNNASLVSQSTTGPTISIPPATTPTPTTPNPSPAPTRQPSTSGTTYKNGTYSAKGTFNTPDGSVQIGVTITLASDKITTVSIDDSNISSRESQQYTTRFVNGINQLVVGKSINSVDVSRVSGASLTPIGFNKALEVIKNDAKA